MMLSENPDASAKAPCTNTIVGLTGVPGPPAMIEVSLAATPVAPEAPGSSMARTNASRTVSTVEIPRRRGIEVGRDGTERFIAISEG
jgi:hypothetical protein